ncbi:unnamed protein product [Echinostoma caproni]|uniref:Nonsense-mediated mRNA decay factor SMG8 n=1 Tax=Echinostoma caproni TaxID=27848 RepID=A0A183B3N4_9TREM|nr:unnamed protein product [Echinostoma caproni]
MHPHIDPPSTYVVYFRDGVPASNWLIGEIPRYPSWSIHALGKYFCYSHSSGLSYPGFLRNSNYLLPWDVVVGSGAWDQGGRGMGKGGTGKYRPGRGDSGVVKLFIGFEMECPLGHRFFLAGPDRAMDGPMQSSQVRYAVQGLLTRDLPLFMPCRMHRSGTADEISQTARSDPASSEWRHTTNSPRDDLTLWAQLTRIYLAIPAAPVRVRFRPRVRPGPAHTTPIFHLGSTLTQFEDRSGLSDSGTDMDDDDIDENENRGKRNGKSGSARRTTSAANDDNHVGCELRTTSKNKQRPGFVMLDNGLLWVARLPYPS